MTSSFLEPFHHFSTANLTVKTSPGAVDVFSGRYSSARTLPANTESDFSSSSDTLRGVKHLAGAAVATPPVIIAEASASACHTLIRNTSEVVEHRRNGALSLGVCATQRL